MRQHASGRGNHQLLTHSGTSPCVRAVTKRGVAFKKAPEPEPEPEEDSELGIAAYGAIASGLLANPIVLWSAWTLKNTGAALSSTASV